MYLSESILTEIPPDLATVLNSIPLVGKGGACLKKDKNQLQKNEIVLYITILSLNKYIFVYTFIKKGSPKTAHFIILLSATYS